jgi:hypothetical protein
MRIKSLLPTINPAGAAQAKVVNLVVPRQAEEIAWPPSGSKPNSRYTEIQSITIFTPVPCLHLRCAEAARLDCRGHEAGLEGRFPPAT